MVNIWTGITIVSRGWFLEWCSIIPVFSAVERLQPHKPLKINPGFSPCCISIKALTRIQTVFLSQESPSSLNSVTYEPKPVHFRLRLAYCFCAENRARGSSLKSLGSSLILRDVTKSFVTMISP